MLGLFLDAAIIGTIIAVMEQDEFPGWGRTLLCALGIGIGTYAIQKGLTQVIGPIAGPWVGIALGAVVGAVVISALLGMSIKRSGIAASIFLGIKVAMSLAFSALLS